MVYIIIVNYNGSDDTIECIKSLLKIAYKKFKIVVLDNNSNESEIKKLKDIENNELFELIELKENLGFAKANNIGMKYAIEKGADYCLLINNDTIVEPNFLGPLVDTFKLDDNIGIVTGLILNYYNHNNKWYDGAKINWDKFEGCDEANLQLNKNSVIREVELISGCLMLIKKELILKNILLPEEYFMFYEDIDYCAKVRKKYGYKLIYNKESVIYHKISQSSGGEKSPFYFKYSTRNWFIFMHKYKESSKNFLKSKLYFYINRGCRVGYFLIKGRTDNAKAIITGIREGKEYRKREGC